MVFAQDQTEYSHYGCCRLDEGHDSGELWGYCRFANLEVCANINGYGACALDLKVFSAPTSNERHPHVITLTAATFS